MFDFKNNVMKIMSKSPNQHLVGLQEKLRLAEKRKKYVLHIPNILLYFSIFQCTNHQPILVADLG